MSSIILDALNNSQPDQGPGVLIDRVQSSSFHLLEGVQVQPAAFAGELPGHQAISVGGVQCAIEHCVSDVSLTQPMAEPVLPDTSWVVHDIHGAVMAQSHENAHLLNLGQSLADQLPKIHQGLEGQLNLHEMGQLISDLQNQLLQLNHTTQSLFPDLSLNLHDVSGALSTLPNEALLTSVQADTYSIFDTFSHHDHGVAGVHTTLDALFTSPEAFPLTLDFSDKHHVEQVHDLFSSHGSSSISTSASVGGNEFAGDSGTGGHGGHNGGSGQV
ncbi:hypothetical protein [Limnobacter sp.]|uniref:hypothetical protein n=1 Tax=Limnobacter sp. TaxID=2003368 RepID=UPI00258B181C|nr:hypothetical protein [Limnobacter sp.]